MPNPLASKLAITGHRLQKRDKADVRNQGSSHSNDLHLWLREARLLLIQQLAERFRRDINILARTPFCEICVIRGFGFSIIEAANNKLG
jgi:hypothetical protein